MESMTAAGIVLYNPDGQRLEENIRAIYPQVDIVVLVDNGSDDQSYLSDYLKNNHYQVIANPTNKGIAYALNQIMEYALAHGIPWVLTLDQDSVVLPNIIGTYESLKSPDIGIISCLILDRNYDNKGCSEEDKDLFDIDWCITSASYTNTKVWHEVGGFDDRMFIDWVDLDFGIAVKNAGYRIVRTSKTKMIHELGRATKVVRIRNYDYIVQNKPSTRYYYSTRNLIYLAKKYPDINIVDQVKQIILNTYVILKYEGNKASNFTSIIKGLVSGFLMKAH